MSNKYKIDLKELSENAEGPAILKDAINNGGWASFIPRSERTEENRISIKDTLYSTDLAPFVKNTVVELVLESVEPQLVLTSLLDRMPAPDGITEFKIPAFSAVNVHELHEGQEFREETLMTGGGMATTSMKSYGASFSITDEAAKVGGDWNYLRMMTKGIANAFVRRKESVVAKHICYAGQPIMDNVNPTASYFGTTSGRDMGMDANGTLTVDDLYKAYNLQIQRGFTPDTLIVHPLAYTMMVRDPMLRIFPAAAGGNIFADYSGMVDNTRSIPNALRAIYGKGYANAGPGPVSGSTVATTAGESDYNLNKITATPSLPIGFPYPLRIIQSHYMPFNHANSTTDMVLADSSSLGAIFETAGTTTYEWKDTARRTAFFAWAQSWGLFRYNEGLGSGTIRNVKVNEQNFWTPELARPTFDVLNISELDLSTPISGL